MAADQDPAATYALKRLRRPNPAGLESVGGGGPDLSDDRIKTSLDMARERFRRIAKRTTKTGKLTAAQKEVLTDADAALRALAHEGDQATITDRQLAGLEAIIVPDGTRPSLFVQDDDVDPGVEDAGTWHTSIVGMRLAIADVAPSVGRINTGHGTLDYQGTGFVVAGGLILTNRHVLEALVGGPDPDKHGNWHFQTPVTIDFAAEFERKRKREFKVTGVAFASPDKINKVLKTSNLDVALLSVEANNGHEDLPPPLRLSRKLDAVAASRDVYVLGYPAKPIDETGEVLKKVFRDEYFVKRFAPGFVGQDPDTVQDKGHHRVFTHDASTLGGNSGSAVVEFRIEGRSVVGLHFGGFKREENYAHSIARIEDVLAAHGATLQDH
jgi:V8-like Glu-specific endopeptidase